MINKRVGTEIRDRRLAFGFSMKELADRTGVSRMTLMRVETGERLSRAVAKRLGKALVMSDLETLPGLAANHGKRLKGSAVVPTPEELQRVAQIEESKRAQLPLPMPTSFPPADAEEIALMQAQTEAARQAKAEAAAAPKTSFPAEVAFSLGSSGYRILCRLAAGDIGVDGAAKLLS